MKRPFLLVGASAPLAALSQGITRSRGSQHKEHNACQTESRAVTDKDCKKPVARSLLNLSEFILSFTIVDGDIPGSYINIQLPFNLTKSSALKAFFARSFNIYRLCATIYSFLSVLNLPPFNFIKTPIFLCYETGRTDAPDLLLLYFLLFCIFLSHSLICLLYPSAFNFCYEFLH